MGYFRYIVIAVAIFPIIPVLSHAQYYGREITIDVKCGDYTIVHHHDWTEKTREKRYRLWKEGSDYSDTTNDFSSIYCLNNRTGDTLFIKPCPAFTKILFDSLSNCIVGLSEIRVLNPFQLVIYSTSGEILGSKHMSAREARMSHSHFQVFKNEFPGVCDVLQSKERIFLKDGLWYIDFMDLTNILEDKVWKYLWHYESNNLLSENFSESVGTFVYWYSKNPFVELEFDGDELVTIEFMDTKNETVTLDFGWIKQQACNE